MRISGGGARGIPLEVPKGDSVRPATDGLRQAVFSSLGARVVNARFLDLFAGSGAYGLEALSRGAAGGIFVEHDTRAAACLRRNVAAVCKSLGRDESGLEVVQADALNTLAAAGPTPDLIFVDPPYAIIDRIAPALFGRLADERNAGPDALVVFEMPGGVELEPPGWKCVKRLGQGSRQPTAVIFKKS